MIKWACFFRPDDWSIQWKRRQSYFLKLVLITDNLSLACQCECAERDDGI